MKSEALRVETIHGSPTPKKGQPGRTVSSYKISLKSYSHIYINPHHCSNFEKPVSFNFSWKCSPWYLEEMFASFLGEFWPLKGEKFRYLWILTFWGKKHIFVLFCFYLTPKTYISFRGGVVVVNCEVCWMALLVCLFFCWPISICTNNSNKVSWFCFLGDPWGEEGV